MRVIVGWQGSERKGASTSEMGRFETEFLTQEDNRQALARMNTRWVERAMAHTLHQRVILDMDSSELEECRTLGGCPTGEARITRGYRLPAQWVIHTVGPVWSGGNSGEDDALADCYRHSLALAEQHNVRTVAFPAISTGAYRFPMERATGIAVRETALFLERNESIEKVSFVCFNQRASDAYMAALGE